MLYAFYHIISLAQPTQKIIRLEQRGVHYDYYLQSESGGDYLIYLPNREREKEIAKISMLLKTNNKNDDQSIDI